MTAPKDSGRLRVLLIDDDEVIAGSFRQYLAMEGCDVDVAVDPVAADALLRSYRYDSVVFDPYCTGAVRGDCAVLDTIETLQPRASTIVLTAYPSSELELLLAGRSTLLLSKPQSVVLLHDLVTSRQFHPQDDM